MPTRDQLQQIWATEFAFPETRRADDPAYRQPQITQQNNMEQYSTIKAFGLETRYYSFSKEYGYGCAECCNGDRCDEDCTAKYKGRRKDCPHCKGKGWIKPEDLDKDEPASPSPVEALEYWDNVYKHTLADKDFLVPAWVLDFADKYAAHIKSPPASSGETMRLEKGEFDKLMEAEIDKLPYTKHVDDGQYNDGQLAGFELGAEWAYKLLHPNIT